MQEQGLGGIMLWSLDLDDPTGKFCNQGPFPLATTVKAVLEGKRLVELENLRSSGTTATLDWLLLLFFVFLVIKNVK